MLLRIFVLFRLYIGIALIALGVFVAIKAGFWASFLLFLTGIIFIVLHFMIGTMRLAQQSMEAGNMDEALAYIKQIKYPNLLFTPIRSAYYMVQSNAAMMSNDLDKAKEYSQKSVSIKSQFTKDFEGQSYFQIGMIAMQKGETKEALTNLKKALELGLPDNNTRAAAYLQIAGITAQRRDFKTAKANFIKAKQQKPTEPQIVAQIKQLEKMMARMPG